MMLDDEYQKILRFWFPPHLNDNHETIVQQFEWWFGGGADAAIAQRFRPMLEKAEGKMLEHWIFSPQPRLALIIILDQFSRSLYRNTARAYAQDPTALDLALRGIELGHYARLDGPWEKTFFLMPLGHSEELKHLDKAVELAEALVREAPVALRKVLEHSASQARGHRHIIARFGRHPHRNAVLGRQSTEDELVYLSGGQLVHRRSIAGR
jgi:uncharacterized protein (DUF924 family)